VGIFGWLFGKKNNEEVDASDSEIIAAIKHSNNVAMEMFYEFEKANEEGRSEEVTKKYIDKYNLEINQDLKSNNKFQDMLSSSEILSETYRFVAVDVETANKQKASICQIGLAMVQENGDIRTLGILIDPEDSFDSFNTALHGISQETIEGAQTFDGVLKILQPFLDRHILIQHSSFDKGAFDAACEKYNLNTLCSEWMDSVKIARAAWPELKEKGGHGLENLKNYLGLTFNHHDAEEDARAAAQVTLLAEEKTGQHFSIISISKAKSYPKPIALEGNIQGPLYGHIACFTGQLTMSRLEAASFSAQAGIEVKVGMSKKITLLIVGDQDIASPDVNAKSSKHRKAEELIENGFSIRIIGEAEFLALIKDT
jgi:DNA polymerase III epsilon subunit-like protein